VLLEKVEVQTSSEGAQNPSQGQVAVVSSQSLDSQMQESLRILSEETLQLSEYLWQEDKLIKELCALLRVVLKKLGLSFNLPPNVLPQTEKAQRIILNDEAHLILINDQNEVKSKALEDNPPNIVFNVISFVIPELGKSLTFYRKRIGVRISLFEKVNQELRKIRTIFESSPKKTEDGSGAVDDGVKKALSTQQNEPAKQ
jgi:hypothetical protein